MVDSLTVTIRRLKINDLFVNASYNPRSSANGRYNEGILAGESLIAQLESKEIILAEGETIKIAGHSQRVASAAGIASALQRMISTGDYSSS